MHQTTSGSLPLEIIDIMVRSMQAMARTEPIT